MEVREDTVHLDFILQAKRLQKPSRWVCCGSHIVKKWVQGKKVDLGRQQGKQGS